MSRLKILRRTTQITIAALFIFIPWLNASGFNLVRGNFLSCTIFGIPFADPLTALQVAITSGSPGINLIVGSLIALTIAALVGAVFCSWVCPYGLLSELNQSLNRRVRNTRYKRRISGFAVKTIVISMVLIAIVILGLPPILNHLSLPGWYSRTAQTWFLIGSFPIGIILLLAAMAVDLISGMRMWCRYCCPQSYLLMLVQRFSPKRLRIMYDPQRCTCAPGKSPCRNACPLLLNPKAKQAYLELECNNCRECVDECAKHGHAITQIIAPKP